MNGDVLTDLDYTRAARAAPGDRARPRRSRRSRATSRSRSASCTSPTPTSPTGSPPTRRSRTSSSRRRWASTRSRRACSRYMEPGERLDFPDLIRRLLDAGEVVRAFRVGLLLARHRPPRRLRAGARGVRADAPAPAPRRARGPFGALPTASRDARRTTIVCVGFAEWDAELWTNQHHLMSRLARDNRVLFVESLGPAPAAARRPRPAAHRPAPRARPARPRRPSTACTSSRPLVLPLHGHAAVRALNARLLPRARAPRAARRARARPARPVGLRAAGRGAARRAATRRSSSTTASTTSPRRRASTRDAFRAAEARFAAPRRPRAGERAGAGRAACARSTATCSTRRTSPTPRCSPRRSSRGPVDAGARRAARPADRLHRRGGRDEARRRRCSPSWRAPRPDWSFVLVGPVGLGDPRTDVSRARGRAERPPARRARPTRSCPPCCAAPTPALIPYALNDADRARSSR